MPSPQGYNEPCVHPEMCSASNKMSSWEGWASLLSCANWFRRVSPSWSIVVPGVLSPCLFPATNDLQYQMSETKLMSYTTTPAPRGHISVFCSMVPVATIKYAKYVLASFYSKRFVFAASNIYELTLVGASHPARGFAPGKLNDLSDLINKLV